MKPDLHFHQLQRGDHEVFAFISPNYDERGNYQVIPIVNVIDKELPWPKYFNDLEQAKNAITQYLIKFEIDIAEAKWIQL